MDFLNDGELSLPSTIRWKKQSKQVKQIGANFTASLQDVSSQSCRSQQTSFFSQCQLLQFQEFGYGIEAFHQVLEKFLQNVRQDNLEEAKRILKYHLEKLSYIDGYKWDLLNDTSLWGWSALHCAAYFGLDRMYLWLFSEGADVSLQTSDGWTSLTLSVWQHHQTIVTLLMGQQNLNINHLSPRGTCLHIAAQQDNGVILALLLTHPKININVRDAQDKSALDMAGTQTKAILVKEIDKINRRFQVNQSDLRNTFRSSISQFIRMTAVSQNSMFANLPKRPPFIKGIVQKLGYFRMFRYERYLILDPESGVLARFKKVKDAPYNPCELIPLESIDDIRFSRDRWFQRDDLFYIRINYFSKDLFIVLAHKSAAKIWFQYLRAAIGYVKYIKAKLDHYANTKEHKKKIQGIVKIMLDQPNQEIVVVDENCINQDSYLEKQKSRFKQKYRGSMLSLSERSQREDSSSDQNSNIKFQSFELLQAIGRGTFGNVYKVRFLRNNKLYALKQQDKDKLIRSNNLKYALSEVNILKQTYNPFLVNLYCAFQTPKFLYLVTDYCPNGDLSKYITSGVILDELVAKFLIAETILAIEYLHSKSIIYRDLKPENITLDDQGHIKLIDFGLSKKIPSAEFIALSFCGSPAYLSPEIIKSQGATMLTDIYTMGAILYEMLTGYPPHYCTRLDQLFHDIRYKEPSLPTHISKAAQTLLQGMLRKEPKSRIGAKDFMEIKKHIFFADLDWNKVAQKQYVPPKLQPRIQFREPNYDLVLAFDEDYVDGDENRFNYIEGWDFEQI